jgi:hypothetical protein
VKTARNVGAGIRNPIKAKAVRSTWNIAASVSVIINKTKNKGGWG